MRKLISTTLALTALVATTLSTPVLGAENPATFTTPAEAETALCTGDFAQYKWQVHAKSPVQGEDHATETAMIVELDTLEGRRFIPAPTGTHLLWKGNQPIGWPGCKNRIWSWKLLSPCPAPVVATPPSTSKPEPAKQLTGLPPTGNIVGSFNTIVVNPDPGKGTKPPGNWYTKSWKNHPWRTGIVHGAIIGIGYGLASSGGGGNGKPGPVVHTDPPG